MSRAGSVAIPRRILTTMLKRRKKLRKKGMVCVVRELWCGGW